MVIQKRSTINQARPHLALSVPRFWVVHVFHERQPNVDQLIRLQLRQFQRQLSQRLRFFQGLLVQKLLGLRRG